MLENQVRTAVRSLFNSQSGRLIKIRLGYKSLNIGIVLLISIVDR